MTARRRRLRSLDDLNETLDVLHREGRRRAVLPATDGGFSNLELIGFTKALATIKVEALSLLEEDDGDDGE